MLRTSLALLMLAAAGASTAARAESPEAPPAAQKTEDTWHRLIGILQYLEADYPAALESGSKFEMDEQNAFIDEAISTARQLGPEAAEFVTRLEDVRARIREGKDAEGVSRDCAAVIEAAVVKSGVKRAPRKVPDMARAQVLYETTCALCHGATGDGNTPIAQTMNPKPANFLDPELMEGTTAYKAFNTVSFGVPGTPMPSFAGLEEDDRWALAFLVLALRHPTCEGQTPQVPLDVLATSTDAELLKKFSPQQVACLRKVPPAPSEKTTLDLASTKVDESMRLARAGNPVEAKQALLDAYLLGIEPVEPRIAARSPELVPKIEEQVLKMRLAIDAKSEDAQKHGAALLRLIDDARGARSTGSMWAIAGMALLIILREGFEALVVIAALLAVLKKMDARAQARVVHAGWVAALFAGAAAFIFGQKLLAGANREWVEGLVALAAVGMLLYAALWLNARANMSAFMKDLRGQMEGALGRGSMLGLFLIAFSAVSRETFETALFLQGLSIDSPRGVAWGAAGGLLLLTAFIVVISRVGYRLPMKTLFGASTIFLFATAVVLLGKGIHALQEVGALPILPIPMLRVDLLGIFPDAFSFGPQLLLALTPLAWKLVRRSRADEQAASAVQAE